MQLITGMRKGMLILSVLAKVEGGTEGKENHSFIETLLVVPLSSVGGRSSWESDQSSKHSTVTRAFGEGN